MISATDGAQMNTDARMLNARCQMPDEYCFRSTFGIRKSAFPHLWLILLFLTFATRTFAQPATMAATRPIPGHQTICLSETDPNSPRKSKLISPAPKPGEADPKEIIRYSLTNNKDHPDVIESWWHGHRVRWIGEGNAMKWTDVRGAQVNDVLQIDRDNDGYYDGPDDAAIKWVDDDNDGRPDLEIVNINPSLSAKDRPTPALPIT